MNHPNAPGLLPRAAQRIARSAPALLLLLASLLYLPGLGARDLWAPNEPSYGLAVREMEQRGDWLVPTLGGREFVDKPILYFWTALAASNALGAVDEFTLRLPLALCGIASVILLYLLVLPYAGRSRAGTAAFLYATTHLVWWASRTVQIDLLVLVSTLAVILLVTRVVDHGLSPYPGWTLAGVAAGFGFLSKGPVAVVLPGVCLLLYLLATRRLRALRSPAVLAGAVVFAAVASPWYLLLLGQGRSDVIREVLWRQNVTRFLEAWDHVQPWWYYLRYFWIGMAPWALFVPLAAALPGRDGGRRALERLAWLWIAGVVAFFSLSECKRGPYLLPVAPAVAILVSGVFERLWNGELSRWRRRGAFGLFLVCALLLLAAGLFVMIRVPEQYPPLSRHAVATGALFIAAAVTLLIVFIQRSRAGRLLPLALSSFLVTLYILAAVSVLPAVNLYKSARGFMDEVNGLTTPDLPLTSYRFWRLRAEYAYYADRPIPNLESRRALRDYWTFDEQVFVLVQSERLEEVRPILGDSPLLIEGRVGEKTTYLFSNRPSRSATSHAGHDPMAALTGEGAGHPAVLSGKSDQKR